MLYIIVCIIIYIGDFLKYILNIKFFIVYIYLYIYLMYYFILY